MPAGVLPRIAITVAVIVGLLVVGAVLRAAVNSRRVGGAHSHARFWATQVLRLVTLAAIIVAVVVIWRDALSELGSVAGWMAAGLTVALQRVVTAFAGYLIILRGNIFRVGDRITIGGVRGDVVALAFMQTTVMEMGQHPGEQGDAPSMWVNGRQLTGRIVRVTNDKVFDTPVYNYTREFPYIWDELTLPVRYQDDRARAEQILLDAARRTASDIVDDARPALDALREHFHMHERPSLEPRVFYNLTDNWLELSVRYLTTDHDARSRKDALSRDVLAALDAAHIGIASGTYALVEVPPLKVSLTGTA